MREPQANVVERHERGEMPKAEEWNALADLARLDRWPPRGWIRQGPFSAHPEHLKRLYDVRHRFTFEGVSLLPFHVCKVETPFLTTNTSMQGPVIVTEKFDTSNGVTEGGVEVLINGLQELGGAVNPITQGFGAYGNTPVLAAVKDGETLVPGERIGPRKNEIRLTKEGAGFRAMGNPGPQGFESEYNLHWVIRETGIAIGQGTMGSPGLGSFLLENVHFWQGIDTADENGTLNVHDAYDDDFIQDGYVTFWWNSYEKRYEICNATCDPLA